jgi:hypothetical protein
MLLIARYNCFVAGEQTDSVDYQVRSYDVPEHTDLDVMLRSEPIDRYRNSNDEDVEWRFVEIVATEWEPRFDSGEEVIGFITGRPVRASEYTQEALQDAPSNGEQRPSLNSSFPSRRG